MRKKIYVFDFDHTLITVNSFRKWTIEFFLKWRKTYSFRENLLSTSLFFVFYFLRFFKVIDHKTLKFLFLKIWMKYLSSHSLELRDFVTDLLHRYGRKHLLSMIEQLPSDAYVIISTAAPHVYAKYIHSILPRVDKVYATVMEKFYELTNFVENKGEEKVRHLYNFLRDNKMKREDVLVIFFTDHADDLPLIKISDKTFLVEPTEDFLFQFKNKDEKVNIFREGERCSSCLTE